MPASMILGYAAMEVGDTLKPFWYAPPELGNFDVRVTVTHCGLCHTDVHAIDDDYNITDYPFVPGHEIVGYVSELGNAVTNLRIGDRVGIGWQGRSCGHCEWCLRGEEQLCLEIVDSGTWIPYGGLSTSVTVDNRFAYQLPDDMPSESAAVLMCAGISVFTPLRANAYLDSRKIAIAGCGGLGHLAIRFAKALGYEVAVISSTCEKEKEAIAFGADQFFPADDRAGLLQHEFEFDLLLVTATGPIFWEGLLRILKKNGRAILVSFPDMSMNPLNLVARNLSICGSFIGNHAIMQEMLAFAQEHGITPRVELMPMSQVNEAIQRVKENKARYRIVLVNEWQSK